MWFLRVSDFIRYQDARPEQQQDLATAAEQPQDDTRALPDVPVPQVQPTGTQRTSLLPSPALSLAYSTITPTQSSSVSFMHSPQPSVPVSKDTSRKVSHEEGGEEDEHRGRGDERRGPRRPTVKLWSPRQLGSGSNAPPKGRSLSRI